MRYCVVMGERILSKLSALNLGKEITCSIMNYNSDFGSMIWIVLQAIDRKDRLNN